LDEEGATEAIETGEIEQLDGDPELGRDRVGWGGFDSNIVDIEFVAVFEGHDVSVAVATELMMMLVLEGQGVAVPEPATLDEEGRTEVGII
jgi:hypothetical protein